MSSSSKQPTTTEPAEQKPANKAAWKLSLSNSRNKNKVKKNWKGSLRNLLPNGKNTTNSKEAEEATEEGLPSTPPPRRTNSKSQLDKITATTHNAASSANQGGAFDWQDNQEQERAMALMRQKQAQKERDGFCRRVDAYDGQVITVTGKSAYELGNYLGGGVAGVVYEGNRLLPSTEYPVRQGQIVDDAPIKMVVQQQDGSSSRSTSFLCGVGDVNSVTDFDTPQKLSRNATNQTCNTAGTAGGASLNSERRQAPTTVDSPRNDKMAIDLDIETPAMSSEQMGNLVLTDHPDAPSRSQYAAKAAAQSSTSNWFMEEKVAIKILNPVGFRILPTESTTEAVVVKEGERMSLQVMKGDHPMEERHVWWLVNPNSRNLQTLQRYNAKRKDGTLKKARDVDRGSPERGLRLSLVAAFMDASGQVRELPLTRCIEIWGHVPFGATDAEFEDMLEAIERVNAGQPGKNPFVDVPSRVPTYDSSTSYDNSTLTESIPLGTTKTGLYRAATSTRITVFCEALNAFIAVPAVPPKYLRWLRQRRSATKEIRNMMLIGRHRNVVHLYEVLEYIQDSKSTMFLILELVRGGELFDLISNNNSAGKRGIDVDSELMMRKFFSELSAGIHYCHANGIAHRDLKPENLLVHTDLINDGTTLKIADFGLSATFRMFGDDAETIRDSIASPSITPYDSPARGDASITTRGTIETIPQQQLTSPSSSRPQRANSFSNNLASVSEQALKFLTCGNVEDVNWCAPPTGNKVEMENLPSPLRRMTSVVGSPHYVAPEIISQSDKGKKNREKTHSAAGYDGTKADVWSAGVILYAMLYRSLPFGEDLLRCPRYQSFRKWYEEARRLGGRRSSAYAALNPRITKDDEVDMLGPTWFFPAQTSPESRDLIVAMLNPNPNDRLSIEFVLQHPWLRKNDLELEVI